MHRAPPHRFVFIRVHSWFAFLLLLLFTACTHAADVPDELPAPDGAAADATKPIKVFILSGQSNMVGFGNMESLNKAVKQKKMFQNLVDEKGRWTTRKDVQYLYNLGNPKEPRPLSVQANGKTFGPELQFGHYMGYLHDEVVLVIKACNGNRCLGYDVLPPSRRDGKFSDPKWRIGCEYDNWFRKYCKDTLNNLNTIYPAYKGQGYEIAGFGWWQGQKDIGNAEWNAEYEENLVALIKDLRADFKAPDAPFVVATVAFGGQKMAGNTLQIHQAQMAVSDYEKYPEFKGNVASVDTRDFYRGGGVHYGGHAETYMLVGEGMGRAMAELILNAPDRPQVVKYPKPAEPTGNAGEQAPPDVSKPLKVYLLSGQSNMVGFGKVSSNGTENLEYLVHTEGKFAHLGDGDGGWSMRNDVFYVSATTGEQQGYMGVETAGGRWIGPELQFGYLMGDHHDEAVLILKVAQGNRSIGFDVMPPSSRVGVAKGAGEFYKGWQYDIFVADAHRVLDNLKEYYPDYQDQGYELAGFCWWQGHKDLGTPQRFYEKHLVNLIKDLREEFKTPKMNAVVATIGFGGMRMNNKQLAIAKAQMAVSNYEKYPEFEGNVASVDCRPFFYGGGAHYGGHAETYVRVGDGLGRAMVKLLNKEPIPFKPIEQAVVGAKKKQAGPPPDETKPVKVYILSGQSNMVGMAEIHGAGPGHLETVAKTNKRFQHLINDDGSWVVRNDVYFVDLTNRRTAQWLTAGTPPYFGKIGPELQFGHAMGDHHDEVVLVIKAAQGNRSIGFDVNPPSSRKGMPKTGTYYPGWQYDVFVGNVHKTLDNLQEYFPEYKGQGYEIAGFCWWQGHKDGIGGMPQDVYEYHLVNLINDLRLEFDAPKAPFSIATLGFGGENIRGKYLNVLKAQMAVSDGSKYPDFAGNVGACDTRPFWRNTAVSPKNEGYHYNRNAETYSLVGDGLAETMIELIKQSGTKQGEKK